MIKAELQTEGTVKVTLEGSKKDIAKELYSILEQITKIGNPDIVSLSLGAYQDWLETLKREAKESKDANN